MTETATINQNVTHVSSRYEVATLLRAIASRVEQGYNALHMDLCWTIGDAAIKVVSVGNNEVPDETLVIYEESARRFVEEMLPEA